MRNIDFWKNSVIIACHYTAALKMSLWQYSRFAAAWCCRFGKYLCGMQRLLCSDPGREVPGEAAAAPGFLLWMKRSRLKRHFLIRPWSKGEEGTELGTSVSEDLSLQVGCLCVFPFTLPSPYLIYPADPLLLCGFMNIFCAWSTFSSPLKLVEQLDYKSGEDCQKEWRGWCVPTLDASSARQVICWPLLATGEFICSVV